MHTPTTTMRLPLGAAAMIWSSTPGTPTHSKTTAGRSGGPGSHAGCCGARVASVHTAVSRQLCQGVVWPGSTTTSAPTATASSRRWREKSAATIGRAPASRSAAITASPTGPQPVGHFQQERLAEPHVLGVATGVVVRVADALGSGGRHQHRARADARARLERAHRIRPVLDDLGAELVAHDDVAAQVHDARVAGPPRGRHELIGELERVQVRAADPAGQRADEHLARPRLGHRDIRHDQLAVPHDGGAHRRDHFWPSASIISLDSRRGYRAKRYVPMRADFPSAVTESAEPNWP